MVGWVSLLLLMYIPVVRLCQITQFNNLLAQLILKCEEKVVSVDINRREYNSLMNTWSYQMNLHATYWLHMLWPITIWQTSRGRSMWLAFLEVLWRLYVPFCCCSLQKKIRIVAYYIGGFHANYITCLNIISWKHQRTIFKRVCKFLPTGFHEM